ncbi:MAG: 6-phosphofructokinase [Anaerolineaceae bacterium]|nr:6-phosphofructokinase [Anaerolineaceae bacterium]
MNKIAVLTSGGDAPGMNAAIRAVVRTGIAKGWEVYGVQQGYEGLMNGHMDQMGQRAVGGIVQQGGTILGSARALEFKTVEGRQKALAELKKREIDGLVVIGGNGSQTGANALYEMGFPVVGIASTIDNDLYGSEMTIGVDTALNIALEAIDRLKITASSHKRAFLLEVMGRDCGYLALMAGIAGGAEYISIPELPNEPEDIAKELHAAYERGKKHSIIVVAEGAKYNANALIQYFKEHKAELGFELRATILGHIQRGGAPTAFDRILATRLGGAATAALAGGEYGVLVGLNKGTITTTPLSVVVANKKSLDLGLIELHDELNN